MDETKSSTQEGPPSAPATAAEPAAAPMTATVAPAPASGPVDGPSLDAIAARLVSWHNRHPLARRISTADVHTLGVVALPFMGVPRQEAREPSLDAPSSAASTPAPAATRRRLALPWGRRAAAGPRAVWDERFIAGASTRQIEAMALAQSYGEAPPEMPLRRIAIAPALAAGDVNQSGAWPMELYLLSAAIDAGPARSRVLIGQLGKVLGRRCLDPRRLGVAAAIGLLLLALVGWALWPSSPKTEAGHDAVPATPASAASAASAVAPTPPSSAASQALAPAEAGSAASAAGASPDEAASAASAAAMPASIALPFPLKRDQTSMQAGSASAPGSSTSAAASAPGAAASAKAAPETPDARVSVDEVGLGKLRQMEPGTKVVALVSLPQKSKADAEAQLARMRELLGQTLKGDAPLNGAVMQTKDGWRAAMWPFASREEAQLVNAMLIARGMRLRAVDF